MNSIIKILSIFFALSLLVLPLTGCNSWEGGMTLVLKIDAPKDDTTVTTPTIMVTGHLGGSEKALAKVSINDADVPVKDGKFSADITLNEGQNVINVVAVSGNIKIPKKVTVTYKK
jgi:hypothetical protein